MTGSGSEVVLGVGCAVVAAVGYGVASVLQGMGAAATGSTTEVVTSRLYLAGLTLDVAAWGLSLGALRLLPVYEVQAILAGSLAVTAVVARVALDARLSRRATAAIWVTTGSLAVLVLASAPGRASTPPLAGRWALALCAVPVVALGALAARRSSSGVVAGLAGLAFAGAALAVRCVPATDLARSPTGALAALVRDPTAWAVPVFAGTGVLLYASALRDGAVGPMTAILWIVEVVVPTVVAVVLLGDGFRAGWALAAVLSLVAATVSAAVLATSDGPTAGAHP